MFHSIARGEYFAPKTSVIFGADSKVRRQNFSLLGARRDFGKISLTK